MRSSITVVGRIWYGICWSWCTSCNGIYKLIQMLHLFTTAESILCRCFLNHCTSLRRTAKQKVRCIQQMAILSEGGEHMVYILYIPTVKCWKVIIIIDFICITFYSCPTQLLIIDGRWIKSCVLMTTLYLATCHFLSTNRWMSSIRLLLA